MPAIARDGVTVHHGDCLDVLRELPDSSVDAVVTDPPYGLEFMGKAWDSFKPANARLRTRQDARTNPAEGKSTTTTPEAYVAGRPFQAWCEQWAAECLRVLRPGGHLAAFGGSRTYHRLTSGIEDAGFEIRDGLQWIYGSGFPKSLDVSKAITATERHGGANSVRIRRARMGDKYTPSGQQGNRDGIGHRGDTGVALGDDPERYRPTDLTENAERWSGFGTALKPAAEPIVLARKPLGGTVAANVLAHGTGALNIDACRVGMSDADREIVDKRSGADDGVREIYGQGVGKRGTGERFMSAPGGRWPSNVLLSHTDGCRPPRPSAEDIAHDRALAELQGREYVPWPGEDDPASAGCVPGCPVAELDAQGGTLKSGKLNRANIKAANAIYGQAPAQLSGEYEPNEGGASRYFPTFKYQAKAPSKERPKVDGVAHPTVKPLDLMRWLVRLVTPPGGTVLDPFAGSGTTVEAALVEGFAVIGIEREPDYLPLIEQRVDRVLAAAAAATPALFEVSA